MVFSRPETRQNATAAPCNRSRPVSGSTCAGFAASLSGDRSTVANIERRATIERGKDSGEHRGDLSGNIERRDRAPVRAGSVRRSTVCQSQAVATLPPDSSATYPASRGGSTVRRVCQRFASSGQCQPQPFNRAPRLSAVRPSAPDSGQYQRQPWRIWNAATYPATSNAANVPRLSAATVCQLPPSNAATVRPCASLSATIERAAPIPANVAGFRPPSVQPLPVRPAIAATVRPSPAPFSRIRRQSIENALASRPPLRSCPRPPWQPIRQH